MHVPHHSAVDVSATAPVAVDYSTDVADLESPALRADSLLVHLPLVLHLRPEQQ